MATFTKLGLTLSKETIEWKINDEIIKVKKYLPIEEKMELCLKILKLLEKFFLFLKNYLMLILLLFKEKVLILIKKIIIIFLYQKKWIQLVVV